MGGSCWVTNARTETIKDVHYLVLVWKLPEASMKAHGRHGSSRGEFMGDHGSFRETFRKDFHGNTHGCFRGHTHGSFKQSTRPGGQYGRESEPVDLLCRAFLSPGGAVDSSVRLASSKVNHPSVTFRKSLGGVTAVCLPCAQVLSVRMLAAPYLLKEEQPSRTTMHEAMAVS